MTNVLSQKAVLARVEFRSWAGRIKDLKVTAEVIEKHKAKSRAGTFTKRLVSIEALADVNAAISQAARYHRYHTQPWLDEGVRILPTALFLEYQEKMDGFKKEFDKAANRFITDYKKFIEQAQDLLGTMFTDTEYPTVAAMKEKFAMTFNFLPCPDAGDFRCDIDDKHLDQIKSELDGQMKDQMRAALADSARKALEVVSRMSERLNAYTPPKKKAEKKKGENAEGTFRDSLVENVKEIAALLPAFNINNDPKMNKLISRINKELCVTDAATLRKDEVARKKVAKSAKEITQAVEEFLA